MAKFKERCHARDEKENRPYVVRNPDQQVIPWPFCVDKGGDCGDVKLACAQELGKGRPEVVALWLPSQKARFVWLRLKTIFTQVLLTFQERM